MWAYRSEGVEDSRIQGVEWRKKEVRSQKTEVRSQKTENGKLKLEVAYFASIRPLIPE